MYVPAIPRRSDRIARIAAYLSVEAASAPHRRTRLVFLAIGLGALSWFQRDWLWMLYLPLFVANDLAWAAQMRRIARLTDVTRRRLIALALQHKATVLLYGSLPVLSAFLGGEIGRYAATLMLMAQVVHGLGTDVRSRDMLLVDIVSLAVVAQLVILGITRGDPDMTMAQTTFLHLGALFLTGFAAQLAFQAHETHLRLLAQREELIRTGKVEAVGRLASGIAHDFNNLLTVMRGNLDLAEELPDAERGPLLAEIARAAERGGGLVRQLLATTSRDGDTEPVAVPVAPFLDRFAEFARRVIPANIDLSIGETEAGLAVLTDPAQLEAALLNLVVNARDAMPAGGRIDVEATRHVEGGASHVVFSVVDDGPGMDAELRATATDPFVTTKPVGKGTGLGLAMVRGFAEKSGGRLDIRSAPGLGTKMHIWLPL
jgi:signal transduction histidine kinase